MIKHPDFVMNNIHRLADFRKAQGQIYMLGQAMREGQSGNSFNMKF